MFDIFSEDSRLFSSLFNELTIKRNVNVTVNGHIFFVFQL